MFRAVSASSGRPRALAALGTAAALVCFAGPGAAAGPVGATAARPATGGGWPGAAQALEGGAAELETALRSRDPSALARAWLLSEWHAALGDEPGWRAVLGRALAVPAVDPLTRAHLRVLRAEAGWRGGAVDVVPAELADVGLLGSAWLLGPLSPEAWRDVATPALAVDPERLVDGPRGPARWRPVADAPLGGLRLGQRLSPGDDVSAVVAAALQVGRAGPLALRLGAPGPVRLWVDGQLVLDRAEPVAGGLDQHTVALDFPPGRHELRVATAWESGEGALRLRVSAPDGGPARDAAWIEAARPGPRTATPAVVEPARAWSGPVRRPDDALGSGARAGRGPSPAERRRLQLALRRILGLASPGQLRSELDAAIAAHPDDAGLAFERARLSPDPGAAARGLERVLELDPGHAPAVLGLGRLALRGQRWTEARRLLERALDLDPSLVPARLELAQLLAGSPYTSGEARRVLARAPRRLRSAALLEARARQALGRDALASADRLALRALRRDLSRAEAWQIRLEVAARRGDDPRRLERLDEQLRIEPWSATLAAERARVAVAVACRAPPEAPLGPRRCEPEALSEARAELDRARARLPDHAELHLAAAELAERAGDRAAERAALSRAAELDPSRAELRGRASEAGDGERPRLDVPARLAAAPRPTDSTAAVEILAWRTELEWRPDGRHRIHEARLLRPLTTDGAAALREFVWAYDGSRHVARVLHARRWPRDGGPPTPPRRVDVDLGPEPGEGGMITERRHVRIELDDVAPGDALWIELRLEPLAPAPLDAAIGWVGSLGADVPIAELELVLRAPAGALPRWVHARLPEPESSVDGGLEQRRWRWTAAEARAVHPFAPAEVERHPWLAVGGPAGPAELAAAYARLLRPALALDAESRAAAAAAVGDRTETEAVVAALFEHVQRRVRYVAVELGAHAWQPHPAHETHRRGFGDCKDMASLLIALLAERGIDAGLALVRTRGLGPRPDGFWGLGAFDHAVVWVPAIGRFLDPTPGRAGPAELPAPVLGADTLIVHPDGRGEPRRVRAPTPDDDHHDATYRLVLDARGHAELEGEERFGGFRSAALRTQLEAPDGRRVRVEANLRQDLPGLSLETLEMTGVARLDVPPTARYRARVDRLGTPTAGGLRLPVHPFPPPLEPLLDDTAPDQDLVGFGPARRRARIVWRFPAGHRLVGPPPRLAVDTPELTVRIEPTTRADGLELDFELVLRGARVPAAARPALRAVAEQLRTLLSTPLELRAGEGGR